MTQLQENVREVPSINREKLAEAMALATKDEGRISKKRTRVQQFEALSEEHQAEIKAEELKQQKEQYERAKTQLMQNLSRGPGHESDLIVLRKSGQ